MYLFFSKNYTVSLIYEIFLTHFFWLLITSHGQGILQTGRDGNASLAVAFCVEDTLVTSQSQFKSCTETYLEPCQISMIDLFGKISSQKKASL